jgi:predicted aldo/keto reductase-like oxidoreductase
MTTRRLGRTGLEVVRIGCGGIPIIKVDFDDAVAVVRAAFDAGCNYFDTAAAYKDSESKMGKALAGHRDEVILATKSHVRDAAGAMEHLENSLRALGTDHVDIWQMHDVSRADHWEQVMGPGGAFEAAVEARDQGKVRFLGLSSHNEVTLKQAVLCGHYDMILTAYNIGCRWPADEVIPLAKQHDVGVAVMKPMSGGTLFALSRPSEDDPPAITPEDLMRFVLSNDDVDVALSGFRRLEEVPQNLAMLHEFVPLSDDERQRLEQFGDSLGGVYCRHCTYCLPCTVNISIPAVLALLDHSERFSYEWPSHRRAYDALEVKADECVECGECESRCPFQVPIIERLKAAHKKFSQPY